jgi:cell division protease FtsH
MAQVVDEETRRLLIEAEQRATALLREHRDQLDRFVEELLNKEELSRAEIESLLNVPRSNNSTPGPTMASF